MKTYIVSGWTLTIDNITHTVTEWQEPTHGYITSPNRLLCGYDPHIDVRVVRIRTKPDKVVRKHIMQVTCPQCKETDAYVEARIEWDHR